LLLRLFKSDRELQLPESTPSRLRALGDFLKFGGRDVHYDVISADDRRPFLYELRRNASELSTSAALSLRRRLGRKGRLIRSEQGTC
jgi:hypothetical protein